MTAERRPRLQKAPPKDRTDFANQRKNCRASVSDAGLKSCRFTEAPYKSSLPLQQLPHLCRELWPNPGLFMLEINTNVRPPLPLCFDHVDPSIHVSCLIIFAS